eukprot:3931680-Rhodomonas_salina.2
MSDPRISSKLSPLCDAPGLSHLSAAATCQPYLGASPPRIVLALSIVSGAAHSPESSPTE